MFDNQVDWKDVYQILKRDHPCNQGTSLWNAEDNLLALLVFEKMGYSPVSSDMAMCCMHGSTNIMRHLLDQRKIDLSSLTWKINNSSALVLSILACQTEIVKMLLVDPRTDSIIYPDLIENVISVSDPPSPSDHVAIVKILLQDERVVPTNECLYYSTNPEVVELLLRDARIDPTANNNAALLRTILRRRVEIVMLLLEDSRIAAGRVGPDMKSLVLSYVRPY